MIAVAMKSIWKSLKKQLSTPKRKTKRSHEDINDSLEIYETEEFYVAGDLWKRGCEKDPTHSNFIDIKKFSLEHLHEEIKDESLKNYILARGNLVVKIKVNRQSPDRLKKCKNPRKLATGYAWCTDQEKIVIYTNKHVVFDNYEAEDTDVDFSFNDKTVSTKGVRLRENRGNKDLVCMEVLSDEPDLYKSIVKFSDNVSTLWEEVSMTCKEAFKKFAVVISHPHGLQKVVSVGKLISLEKEDEDVLIGLGDIDSNENLIPHQQHLHKRSRKVTRYETATCVGSSGAPVLTGFYPLRPFTHSGYSPQLQTNYCLSY